ncbi:MAG: FecR domain-containing protein [Melioribacteraceae bacterium]|nr:FecR domain-containing protein [Melioribacteraceae bacterium]
MKRIVKFLTAGVALFTISTFSLTPPSVGVLTKMIQQVEFKAAETDAWDEAELGSIMNNGDEIRTGARSLALIKFLDNSLLRLRENSVVTLYGTKEESKLNKNTVIQQGRVGFEVTPQDDQEFKIHYTNRRGINPGNKGFLRSSD